MQHTNNSARTRDLLARLESQLASLTTSDGWQHYLALQAKLSRYSWRNTLLVLAQKPAATQVAGYQAWRDLGRQVRRGERGIAILAPHTYSLRANRDSADSGSQATDSDIETRLGFHVTHVWDVSQTDGPELAGRWGFTTGDEVVARQALARLRQFAQSVGFAIDRRSEAGSARGHCDHKGRVIVLDIDLDTVNTLAVLAHELAHALLHECINDYRERRAYYEAEAESVAYVVVAGLGLNPSRCQLPYLAHWTEGDMTIVREAAQRVQAVAHKLLTAVSDAAVAAEALPEAA